MVSLRSASAIGLLGSVALLLTSVPSLAAAHRSATRAVTAECTPTAVKTKVSQKGQSTTSQSGVNVTGTRIDFPQGGTGPSCVIVSFSSEAREVPGETLVVEAV